MRGCFQCQTLHALHAAGNKALRNICLATEPPPLHTHPPKQAALMVTVGLINIDGMIKEMRRDVGEGGEIDNTIKASSRPQRS